MHLNLSDGNLKHFDGLMYPRLTHLNVSYNKITSIINCPNLISLNARGNYLTRFELDCPKLSILKLESNRLVSFVGNYPYLTDLKLDDNLLQTISGRFPSLVSFTATYNYLSTLGGSFAALKSLDLSHNPLIELDVRTRLANLDYLNLTGCNIRVHVGKRMKKVVIAAENDVLGGSHDIKIISRSYY